METPPRSVLFVLTSLDVGGIESYLLKFLRYANGAIAPVVLCKGGRDGALLADYKATGARIIRMDLGASLSLRYLQLWKLMKDHRFDAVCDFTGDFAGQTMLTARLAGVENRITFYRGSRYQFRPTLLRLAFARASGRLARRFSSRVLSNSRAALDRFQPGWTGNGKMQIIRNPAPVLAPAPTGGRALLRHAMNVSPDAFVISHVGRVTPAKNHDFMFDVAEKFLRVHQNAVFVFCGRGLNETFGQRYKDHPIMPNLRLFEHREDVIDVLRASDAFFFPSLNEGMPNALVEAMAVATPIVASNIPAIKEVFPARYSDFLIDIDDVNGAVERLETLMSDPPEGYGQALAVWTKDNFSLEKTFGAFLTELRQQPSPCRKPIG